MTNSSKRTKKEKLKLDFTENDVLKIKRKIRATEYYGLQDTFDKLYTESKHGRKFNNLLDLIASRDNILLAFRTIKKNDGGKTPGVDGKTIQYLQNMRSEELVQVIQNKFSNYHPKPVKRTYIPKVNGKKRPLGIPCIEDRIIQRSEELVQVIQNKFSNYHPKPVKRTYIPKVNGKKRPLGIPCIEDRIIQQCIKQVLEPICEAKFHAHSYGFRPDRKAEDAVSTFMRNLNMGKCVYVVDIDIKRFFDNVNHAKLLKQMWYLGIQDKNLLCVIKKCLNAPIEEEVDGKVIKITPSKGTPQGGVLSPLLANIVLNELDWWISDQWATYKAREVKARPNSSGSECHSNKYRALRKSNLKEGYLVRYADDFKICCKTKEEAERWYHATTQWLKDRLDLDFAPDKSKVTNLKSSSSEFLGLRFKLKPKGKQWVVNSWMTRKAYDNMKADIKQQISRVQRNKTVKSVQILNAKILGRHNYYRMATHINEDMTRMQADIKQQISRVQRNKTVKSVQILNAKILGRHNYYRMATHINEDMTRMHYELSKRLHNRLGNKEVKKIKHKGKNKYEFKATETYNRLYGNYNYKPTIVCNIPIFPIGGCRTKTIKGFNQLTCRYTKEGRERLHKNLECVEPKDLRYLIENPIQHMSVEYNDNRISLFTAQWGACGLTGFPLDIKEMECHHKLPKHKGGKDNMSVEYNDNRISLFTAQWGACGLTGFPLDIKEMECHHKLPKHKGGKDNFNNLILLDKASHKLIHATRHETITHYLNIAKGKILLQDNAEVKLKRFYKTLNTLDKASHKLIHATRHETITHYLNIAKGKILLQDNAEVKLKRFYKTLNTLRKQVGNTPILDNG